MEIWKVVPSDTTLEASSEGRIRIIPHHVAMPRGGFRQYGGNPTKGQWAKDTRRYLYCRKGHKTRKVSILVCEAFHGLTTDIAPNCLHKDENARNNKPNNLKWGTQKENLNYPKFIAYCKSRKGDNNPFIKGRRQEHANRTK